MSSCQAAVEDWGLRSSAVFMPSHGKPEARKASAQAPNFQHKGLTLLEGACHKLVALWFRKLGGSQWHSSQGFPAHARF